VQDVEVRGLLAGLREERKETIRAHETLQKLWGLVVGVNRASSAEAGRDATEACEWLCLLSDDQG